MDIKDTSLKLIVLKGKEILPYIPNLANLRIKIFREYPYLYEGNLVYEERYLQTYIRCSESIIIVVLDKNNVVGASSAIPLKYETMEFKKPFIDHHIAIEDVFYFGESVLEKDYRGKNIYRYFFYYREQAAKAYGCEIAAFAAVQRKENDPRQPKNYHPLDDIWHHFGYTQHRELCAYLPWKEIGESLETVKPLIFWLKNL